MRIRVLAVVIFGLLLGQPAAAQILPIPPGWQMERAILLSRHGVRSPTKANEEMDRNGGPGKWRYFGAQTRGPLPRRLPIEW